VPQRGLGQWNHTRYASWPKFEMRAIGGRGGVGLRVGGSSCSGVGHAAIFTLLGWLA
jgi:hypothetical protein